jgi:hypothetical protein
MNANDANDTFSTLPGLQAESIEWNCKYCNDTFAKVEAYERHSITKHPGELAYPDRNGRS